MKERVTIVEFETLEDFLEDLGVEEQEGVHWIDGVEEDYPDMTVIVDEEFESIIDTLTYNGISEDEIVEMSQQQYGRVIDIYHIKGDRYIMLYGAR